MCPFFNDQMDGMPVIAEKLKQKYCLNDNSTCARFMVREVLGKTAVPKELYPNDKKAAVALLQEARSA